MLGDVEETIYVVEEDENEEDIVRVSGRGYQRAHPILRQARAVRVHVR